MAKSRKIPVQIYLEPEQERIIRLLSKGSGKSKAAIIRDCITRFTASLPIEDDPALKVMNLGSSGKGEIAEKHDEYLSSDET